MTGQHRDPARGRTRRGPFLVALAVVVAAAAVAVAITSVVSHDASRSTRSAVAGTSARSAPTARPRSGVTASPPADRPWLAPPGPHAVGHLRAGSNPAVLPADLLIADKLNNRLIVIDPLGRIRWQFPRPGDLAPGQTFRAPDDAFFSPDGAYIVATQEDHAVISVIDIARQRIVYRYGIPDRPGSTANHLSNPDDAMRLPNGDLLTADIKNCRLLIIAPGAHRPARVIGSTTTACLHDPPRRWGSPNGIFPMRDGRYLVTEINGDWVDTIGLDGRIFWSMHPPGVSYPSDSNEIGPDRYLVADYSSPGQIVIFNRAGHRLWSYRGRGSDTLNHPSLALPLPNGDIVLNDDYNHRVVVVDPRTDRIAWQYGITGVSGNEPGHLNNPDGIDLVPPQSLLVTHASTMGLSP